MTILDPEHFAATLRHIQAMGETGQLFDAREDYVAAHRLLFPNDVVRVEQRDSKETFERHVLGMLADHWKDRYPDARGPRIERLDANGSLIPKDTISPYADRIRYKFA